MPDKENIMQDAVLYFTNANGEKAVLNAANFSINKAAEAFNKVGDKIYETSKSFRDFVHGFEFSATCKFPMGWRKTQLVMLGISSKNDIRYVYRHAEKWRRYYKKKGITHVDQRMLFNTAVLDLLWRRMETHNKRGKLIGSCAACKYFRVFDNKCTNPKMTSPDGEYKHVYSGDPCPDFMPYSDYSC